MARKEGNLELTNIPFFFFASPSVYDGSRSLRPTLKGSIVQAARRRRRSTRLSRLRRSVRAFVPPLFLSLFLEAREAYWFLLSRTDAKSARYKTLRQAVWVRLNPIPSLSSLRFVSLLLRRPSFRRTLTVLPPSCSSTGLSSTRRRDACHVRTLRERFVSFRSSFFTGVRRFLSTRRIHVLSFVCSHLLSASSTRS